MNMSEPRLCPECLSIGVFWTDTPVLERSNNTGWLGNQLADTAVMRASPKANKHAQWLGKQLSGVHKQAVLSQSQFVRKGE